MRFNTKPGVATFHQTWWPARLLYIAIRRRDLARHVQAKVATH